MLAQSRGHRRARDVDPAGDDHVVDPTEHLQPTVLVEAAGVGGVEPAVDQHLGGQPGVAVVAVEDRGPGQPDATRGSQRDRHTVERDAVVDAAARGLGSAVRRDHAHTGRLGAGTQRGVYRPPAEQHGVEGPQRPGVVGGASPAVPRRQHPVQLGGDERGEARHRRVLAQHRRGRLREARVVLGEDRSVPGEPGPAHNLGTGDVGRRQGQQPRPLRAEARAGRPRRREHRPAAQDDPLGSARRAGGRHDQPLVVVALQPPGEGAHGVGGAALEVHGDEASRDAWVGPCRDAPGPPC